MSIEDKKMSRLVEREIHRFQSLDVDDVRIQVTNGVAYIGGVIRPALGMYNLNIKEELRILGEASRKIPGLKSLVIDARVETTPKR